MPRLALIKRCCWCVLGITAIVLPACTSDGQFTLLGYTTAPPYDCSIRTVHVPIFQNRTFRRNLEIDFTRAVIREIEAKTPYKTTDCRTGADTELVCTIINIRKSPINMNQLGEVREGEFNIGVEVIWRDLRPGHTGDVLSSVGKKEDDPFMPVPVPRGNKTNSPPGPQPVLISPTATFIPELGGSMTSAEKRISDNLAVQIVSMMERWGHN